MNDTGQEARDPSLPGPDDASPGTLLPLDARVRGSAWRYSRHRMRWLAAAVAVAAAALAAGVTAALQAAPSPMSVVTSALARTAAGSYTFSLDSTTLVAGKEWRLDVLSGAFDARHGLGTELLTARASGQHPVRAQIRFIGTYLYTWVSFGARLPPPGRPWDKTLTAAAAADGMPPGDLYGFVSDQPVSPNAIAAGLRSAGAAVRDSGTASGPGWTGTRYTFAVSLGAGQSLSGTVYVDQRGQVRRLVSTTRQNRITAERDLTFGHFGAPVPVIAPPASQVQYTSGRPFWGFYF